MKKAKNRQSLGSVSKADFARIAGTGKSAISKAVKRFDLVEDEAGRISLDDPLNQYYLVDRGWDGRSPLVIPKKEAAPHPGARDKADSAESLVEIKRRHKIADMCKKELHVKALEKKFLPIEYTTAVYSAYLDTLAERLTTTAPDAIREAGRAILDKGEIDGEVIENFTAFMLTALHEVKAEIQRRIETGEIEKDL